MIKIGIVSDTHGNIQNLNLTVSKMKQLKVNLFIHLGDDIADIESFELGGLNWLKVPGVYEECYFQPGPPNRLIKEFEGLRFLLTHSLHSHPNDLLVDLKPEELRTKKDIDVILFGHTHIPEIREEERILLINPGHLKSVDKKRYPPSFAILECQNGVISIKIIELLTEKIIMEKENWKL
ncbi:MAG: metallophosphoesterase family protein [Candidatus Aminicenantia bacterium]